MEKYPHIRWSAAIRSIIEQKLADFEEAERLAKKGGLTERDIRPVVLKVNKDASRHAKRLLHAANR